MNSPANIIQQFLIDEELGTVDGEWKAFVAFLPERPDDAICVFDTVGRLDGRIMRTGEQIEHPGIQVFVRGKDYLETYRKAKSIALALDAVKGVEVAMDSEQSFTLLNVSRTGSMHPVGVETEGDRRRHRFAINAVLTLAPTVVAGVTDDFGNTVTDDFGNLIPAGDL